MKQNIKLRLKIFSDEQIDTISKKLGIDCTSWHLKGDEYAPRKQFEKNIWIYETIENGFEKEPAEMLETLQVQLNQKLAILKEFSSEGYVEFSFVIEADREPPLHFPSPILIFLAETGASLDIDQYIDANED